MAMQWYSKVHVDIQVMLTHFILNGEVVVDAERNGMFAAVYGDDPNNYWGKLNATVVVHPNANESVTIWDVNNNHCSYDGTYNDSNIPTLRLPGTASYLGNETVDQTLCEVWQVNHPYKDVEYCKLLVGPVGSSSPLNILMIKALYVGASAKAYFNIRFFQQNNSKPDAEWFSKPSKC